MHDRLATLVLVVVCAFSLPCLYFVFFAGGVLPLSVMTGLTLMMFAAGPGSDGSNLLFGLLSLANVVVWGVAVIAVCRVTVRAIYFRFGRTGDLLVGAIIVAVAAIGLLPIFFLAGHAKPITRNAYVAFFEMVAGQIRGQPH